MPAPEDPSAPEDPAPGPADLESRWRDWQPDDEAAPRAAADPTVPARLRPPSGRTAVLVGCVLALLAAGVAVVARLDGGGPQAVLPGGDGPQPSASVPASEQPARDLTGFASATASGFAASTTDAGGGLVSYLAANAVDGDPATSWRTDGPGDGASLTLDFAQEVTVTAVAIAVGEPAVASGDSSAARQGRSVEQVSWTLGDRSVAQQLDPALLETQRLVLPAPVTTRSVTLHLDRTAPGPVATDDFSAVTEIVVLGTT